MLIPLGTDRPLHRPTLVTYALLALNVTVALVMAVLEQADPDGATRLLRHLWLQRSALTPWSLFTYAFVHAGALHLLGNMLALWVFGPNVEDKLGRAGFIALYLGGAVLAGSAHVAFDRSPVVGASGAIAAVTGSYLIFFPKTNIRCLVFFFLIGIFTIPAWWFIAFAVTKDLFWIAAVNQRIGGVAVDDGVARAAHLGGYAFGAAISLALIALRLVSREPYDLFTIMRQAGRRRAIREATLAAERRTQRRTGVPAGRSPEEDSRAEAMARARAEVSAQVSRGELEAAAEGYRRLLETYGDLPGAATLSRQHLYDLANHLFQTSRHALALEAYERFLSAYPKDAHAPSVRLMVGLINARYLNDPIRAKQVLDGLDTKLEDAREKQLAQELVAELA